MSIQAHTAPAISGKSQFVLDNDWQYKTNQEKANKLKPDSIIDVYKKGVKKGKEKAIKEMGKFITSEHKKNMIKAQAIGERLFGAMNKMKLDCSKVFLMVESMQDYRLLFLINKAKYLSKEFDAIHDLVLNERKKHNGNEFYVSVMFMPEVPTTDASKIIADGYYFSYHGKAKK